METEDVSCQVRMPACMQVFCVLNFIKKGMKIDCSKLTNEGYFEQLVKHLQYPSQGHRTFPVKSSYPFCSRDVSVPQHPQRRC